jgi:hypothetical protein
VGSVLWQQHRTRPHLRGLPGLADLRRRPSVR